MNEQLLVTLRGLKKNPALAIELYDQLFSARFWALVADPTVELSTMSFLTYPCPDGIRELPIFTAPNHPLMTHFGEASPPPATVELEGEELWLRMLEVVENKKTQVAVDPGDVHGIRISREMILGMVSTHRKNSSGQ
jgi:hypothetical protein